MIRRVVAKLSGCGCEGQEAELDALRREVRALRAQVAELEGAASTDGPPVVVGSFAQAAKAMAAGQQAMLQAGAEPAPGAPEPPATPVDAPVDARTLVVELEDCIACGTCVEYCADAFELGSDGRARVVSQAVDAQELSDAMEACPTQCIRWEG
jgi:ferredoxin